jgi:urease accessory protein
MAMVTIITAMPIFMIIAITTIPAMTMVTTANTNITTITNTTTTATIMDTAADAFGVERDASLLPLMVWLSPAFPVGAFAYSHGLEWAVEAGDIFDAPSLEAWLVDLIDCGAPRADAILFAVAFRAAQAGDWPALEAANALGVTLSPSAERRMETTAQGAAFVAAARAAWDCEPLQRLSKEERVAYPIAVASAAAGHGLALEASLEAFVLALIANAISAVVRLGPIGQTAGQKILATLMPKIRALARDAASATLADLGGAAFRSDIASMRHETQYSRLFRS